MAEFDDDQSLIIAQHWCAAQGADWRVLETAGRGGTAPVYTLESPDGLRALKVYDREFSEGSKGEIEAIRVSQQVRLGDHACPYMVKVYAGGQFEGRNFLLMSRAPGRELSTVLRDVPRSKIRKILHQVTTACLFLRSNGLCHRDIKTANIFVSDDFEMATLLDLSVIREINDPVGIGTDHGGQLPVVATARYSPPEYLFRIVDPSPALWHSLDVYQLGGLLHDLIMQEQLFEEEFQLSKENRYRFAWIVATLTPTVQGIDVDQDLVLLARRALDKDWDRRSRLRLEDFLDSSQARRLNGLQAIGLVPNRPSIAGRPRAEKLRRVTEVAKAVKDATVATLATAGVTATHVVGPGTSDDAKRITLNWNAASGGGDSALGGLRLDIDLTLSVAGDAETFDVVVTLSGAAETAERSATAHRPNTKNDDESVDVISAQVGLLLGDLASELLAAK